MQRMEALASQCTQLSKTKAINRKFNTLLSSGVAWPVRYVCRGCECFIISRQNELLSAMCEFILMWSLACIYLLLAGVLRLHESAMSLKNIL